MTDSITDNIKQLQQLAEAKGGATALDWSTISHTHGGGAESPQNANFAFKVQDLQQLAQPTGATVLEWSTISHTHGA